MYAKGDELEGLDEKAIGNVVVNSIHLRHKTIRVVLEISEVVSVFSTVEIAKIVPFLKYCLLIFGKLSAGFAPQVEITDSGSGKNAPFNVVVQRFLTDPQVRMVLDDGIRRLPLSKKRLDNISHFLGLCFVFVNSYATVDQRCFIFKLSFLGFVKILVVPAMLKILAAIASFRGSISTFAYKRLEL